MDRDPLWPSNQARARPVRPARLRRGAERRCADWRAGANVSTRLITELPLLVGGKRIAPGEYTIFIELKRSDWTLIVSGWPAQTTYDDKNKQALWGAYDYTPDRDIVRTPMRVENLPHAFEQLSWEFLDITDTGGRLAMIWDKKLASVPFTFGK